MQKALGAERVDEKGTLFTPAGQAQRKGETIKIKINEDFRSKVGRKVAFIDERG